MCLLTITKPFASELETHTSKINVSPVSATLYTFMANAQAWYEFLQNVYKFLYTASYQTPVVRFCGRSAADLASLLQFNVFANLTSYSKDHPSELQLLTSYKVLSYVTSMFYNMVTPVFSLPCEKGNDAPCL